MKKYIYTLLFAASIVLGACSEDKLDSHSIFDTESPERNAFDTWLLLNYVVPYNIQFNYKYIDKESDNTYNLIPAEYDKCVAMAKLTKYLWIDSYNELLGETFIKTYCPRMIQLIGSKAYNSQGSVVLGTAEGGLKITLYNVNELNANSPDIDFLNTWFFKTMHHEFAHILQQTKSYDPDYDRISEGLYVSGDWYQETEKDALANGFISPYAMSEPREDIAEVTSIYVTNTAEYWAKQMEAAGTKGADIINQKLSIVKNYMQTAWNIDMDELRNVVQRRMGDVVSGELDLETLK